MFQLYNPQGPVEAIAEPTAITVGVFDGVHLGHQALIRELTECDKGLSPLVVTLTSHPSFVLGRRQSEYWLDDPQEHLHLLFEAGAKQIAVMPFTRELSKLTACQMARLMQEQLGMKALLLGYDGRFGSKDNDDFQQLPTLGQELGFSIVHGSPFVVEGQPISSSRIRETLEQGAVDRTASLLGRPYSISGTVRHGRGVGHTIGFPTANIDLSRTRKMLPREGVYAVNLRPLSSTRQPHIGMANLGPAPTFGIDAPLLEVHLPGYKGDLYDQEVEVQFLGRLRDIRRFTSAAQLQDQLHHDVEQLSQWK